MPQPRRGPRPGRAAARRGFRRLTDLHLRDRRHRGPGAGRRAGPASPRPRGAGRRARLRGHAPESVCRLWGFGRLAAPADILSERRPPRGCAGSPFVTSAAPVRAASMQEIKEQPTTASEATDGLAAAALRAEAWAGEPFLREGEDPAQVLAPDTSRRRALDDALAEIEAGHRAPSPGWKVQYGLMLGLERVLAEQRPHLASGTELRRHQVDALAGMLTELIASHEKAANGNGAVVEAVEEEPESEEESSEEVLDEEDDAEQ